MAAALTVLQLVAYSIVKFVKDKTAWNFPKKAAVLINSYGLAPPIPQYPLIRSFLESLVSPPKSGRQASLAAQSFPSPKIAARDFFCATFLPATGYSACWLKNKQAPCQFCLCANYPLLISEISALCDGAKIFSPAARWGRCAVTRQFCDVDRQLRRKILSGGWNFFQKSALSLHSDGLEPPIPQYPHRSVAV